MKTTEYSMQPWKRKLEKNATEECKCYIPKTELNSANRIQTMNLLAMPVLTYSFNIIA